MDTSALVSALVGMLAAFLGAAGSAIQRRAAPSVPPADTIEERLRQVARTMDSSAQLLVQVQEEISVRMETVEQLQRDAVEAERVAAINVETRDAMRKLFKDELDYSVRRSSRSAMLVNGLFFMAGIAASIAVTLFIKPA